MAQYQITVASKGLRKASVEKLLNKFKEVLGNDVVFGVTEDNPPNSRADQFDLARTMVEDAKGTAEELRDSLQDWYDNLPEQFQSGDKGDQLESAIQSLDEFCNACENALGVDVEFPGMY